MSSSPFSDSPTRFGWLGCVLVAAFFSWGCPGEESSPPEDCSRGDLGCACTSGDVCALDGDGRQLACALGVCELAPCAPGDVGCACTDAGACGAGLECSEASGVERCEVAGCVIGDLACGCALDRTCAAGSACQQGVCAPQSCAVGTQGCACSERFTCATGLRCDLSSDTCEAPPSCTPGNAGCACDAGGACVGELACVEGTCEDPSCALGDQGCRCEADGGCGVGADGEDLACVAGICKEPSCPPGETGCACAQGGSCDGAEDACTDGFCQSSGCVPGEESCACLGGSCDPGLVCKDGAICSRNEGQRGGPCFGDETCDTNLKCDTSILPSVCVFCDLGTIGCQCTSDSSCNAGLTCLDSINHCVGDETVVGRTPPSDPTCVSTCERSVVTENGERQCVDGFIEGCLDDLACVNGSCIVPGSMPAVCFEDANCPEFQLCIDGSCFVECANNSDCAQSGERTACHKRVCREPCSLDEVDSICPSGFVCDDSSDGVTGFCMARGASTGQPNPTRAGSLDVSTNVLEFTNTQLEKQVRLTNTSESFISVTLRKVDHNVLLADGSVDRAEDFASVSECAGVDCPLWWIEMGEFGAITQDRAITVRVPPRCVDDCPEVTVRLGNGGAAIDATRWRGAIEVESELGAQRLDLSYVASPTGRWTGKMYYYANFETEGIDATSSGAGWSDRADKSDVTGVRNGLIQRWSAFRRGNLQGWNEMEAVLTSTQTRQWAFPNVVEDCIVNEGACYLYDSGAGTLPIPYVTVLDETPIPQGLSEFPMAMNLYVPDRNRGQDLEGRIVSDTALHYAGDPKVALRFQGDPGDTGTCAAGITANCVNFIEEMDLTVVVGGRYEAATGSSQCAPGFVFTDTPWLVPGFLDATSLDPSTGRYEKGHCVDARLPFFDATTTEQVTANKNLAMSNPIPDGKPLVRTVEFLDGAMIDHSEMFILFRESYPSFLGNGEDMVAYGYMLLERSPAEIELIDEDGDGVPDAYQGSEPPKNLSQGSAINQVQCSRELLDEAIGLNVPLTVDNAEEVIRALVDGGELSAASRIVWPDDIEEVHYLCEETGLFDGGPEHTSSWTEGGLGPNDDSCVTSRNGICEDGGFGSRAASCALGGDVSDCGDRYVDVRVACPTQSNVIFFTTDPVLLPNISAQPCQRTGTCLDQLNLWLASNNPLLKQVDAKWTCEGSQVFCDDNALDRRAGKVFYEANAADVPFFSFRAEMEDAFRYKTRFRARDNSSTVGFVPEVCVPFSDSTPYCYDPEQIEGLRERVDCLLDVYDQFYDSQTHSNRPGADLLYTYLEENFGVREEPNPLGGLPVTHDGFERLYSELLIMLGDDAFTDAFESRFDLAGSLAASFEGSRFEENGLDLSGIAGFEMFKLYQAVQYYDMVLARFYAMGDVMGASLRSGAPATQRNFISAATVTSYFDRLIRASTQRSRVLAEIARRYQSFNRPDLASRVASRAYTATYLESVVLANVIVKLYDEAGGSERPELLRALERSQLRYRMTLLDLANVNDTISQEINFFGYPADYIPFPALDNTSTVTAESNAFEKVLKTMLLKLDVARTREQRALDSTRTYETDTASFQAELTRISRTYENQLGDICGLFTDANGVVRPAIEQFAFLDERLSLLGDPCGFAGNGTLHQAITNLELRQLDARQSITQIQNTFEEIEIERELASTQCGIQLTNADFQIETSQRVFNLEEEKLEIQQEVERFQRVTQAITSSVESATNCLGGGGGGGISGKLLLGACLGSIAVLAGAAVVTERKISSANERTKVRRDERQEIESGRLGWDSEIQCAILDATRDAAMKRLTLRLRDLELSMLSAEYQIQLALSEIGRLRQQAKRTELEFEEALGLSINVEAAKNDPNIRIYRNDSVINAEISFEDALREAYRLTLVYEYYTSTTYTQRDQLFLIRMISSGEYNLENYVFDLRNAFITFEEVFGLPETRLEILSLMDDIMQIPRTDADGEALTVTQREALLRQRMLDPGMLNAQGYITVPFRTSIERLSPLTRNHKIFNIEANIVVGGNPDFLGRLYLRQVGTSVVRSVEDESIFYQFPDRTAVIDPFFNSSRQLKDSGTDIYKSYRLRERPLINTSWELVFNQRDEFVNQDINLEELSDIILFIYYNDFTVY